MIEHNKHFFLHVFLGSFRVAVSILWYSQELVDKASIISYFPSANYPTLGRQKAFILLYCVAFTFQICFYK